MSASPQIEVEVEAGEDKKVEDEVEEECPFQCLDTMHI
jgi:hypothetical protein